MPRGVAFRETEDLHQALPRVHTGPCHPEDGPSTSATPTGAQACSTPQNMDDMFRTDNFMMYGFKIAMCTKQGRHPWCECPYAHPTENARRRDPRVFSYNCAECPAYRNSGFCAKGDQCEHSHGVFEARLHPDSYRTVQCKDGSRCRRKICFFFHSPEEARRPTGLQDARAQLAAEMGTGAIDMDIDSIRSVANSILTANPSLANTMKSMSSSLTPVSNHQTMLNSVLSNANSASASLPAAGSLPRANSGALSRVMSGNMANAASGALMASETVAPCMKGANKSRLIVKELATEVAIHPDALMSAFRIAALQGELTAHSAAPAAPRGSVPEIVERILMRMCVLEDCPIDKLRGWLLRVPGTTLAVKSHDAPRKDTPAWRLQSQGQFASSSADHSPRSEGNENSESPAIRAHFGGNGNGGGGGGSSRARRGWDVRPPPRTGSGGGFGPSARSAIDAARW